MPDFDDDEEARIVAEMAGMLGGELPPGRRPPLWRWSESQKGTPQANLLGASRYVLIAHIILLAPLIVIWNGLLLPICRAPCMLPSFDELKLLPRMPASECISPLRQL